MRQSRSECLVEHERQHLAQHRSGPDGLQERLGVGFAALSCRHSQRLEVRIIDDFERTHQSCPDLGFGQRSLGRLEERVTQMKGVVRELQVEERCLALLVLRGGRQDVMREPCGLGHRHVDDHHQLQRRERRTAGLRVGQ